MLYVGHGNEAAIMKLTALVGTMMEKQILLTSMEKVVEIQFALREGDRCCCGRLGGARTPSVQCATPNPTCKLYIKLARFFSQSHIHLRVKNIHRAYLLSDSC